MDQEDRAAHFRALHSQRPLILLNAWDVATARVLEIAGASAVGTTSGGISWAHGRRDGQQLQRDEMVEAIRRIVQMVTVPVTADIESGYGNGSTQDVFETVRGVVAAGAVGINLEDSPGRGGEPLIMPEKHAERIRAARQAALAADSDVVINARTDVYLFEVGDPETRLDATIRRAELYREAGADCTFVPGVIDAGTISTLVQAIDGPVNVMAGPGAPSVTELGRLGVARVSVGSAIAQAALATTRRGARELLLDGTYRALSDGTPFSEVNGMFSGSDAVVS